MHRDTVIGIVGVVILVAAMVGVFTYERNQAANLGPDGFELANLTGPSVTGTTAVGAETAETVNVTQANMTTITFTLTWTANVGTDTLQLEVAPAAGTGLTEGVTSAEENDGEITVTLQVPNTEPTGGPQMVGVGDYQVTVRFVRAEAPTPVQPPVQPPVGTDQNVAWSIATTMTAYEPATA